MRERKFRKNSLAAILFSAVSALCPPCGAQAGEAVSVAAAQDEFSIFLDSPLQEEEAQEGQEADKTSGKPPGKLELGFEAEALVGARAWNAEFFAFTGAETPKSRIAVSASVEPEIAFLVLPGLAFRARAGIECSGSIGEGGSSSLAASIPEASLSAGIPEGFFLRAGILPLDAGSEALFNPAFWPRRFSSNIYTKGGASFLGLEVSAYFGDFKLALLCLPEIAFPVSGLFRTPAPLPGGSAGAQGEQEGGTAAEGRLSLSLLGGSASFFGFCQTKKGALEPRFGGLGFEAAFPMGKWADIRGEGLYSSGLPEYGLAGGLPSLKEGTTSEWGLACAFSLGATGFSLLELRAGYSFSGRGLPASDWKNPLVAADGRLFPRHELFLQLVIPKITDESSLTIFALLSPEDLSARFWLEGRLNAGDSSSFALRGELSPSPAGSVYGSGALRGSISLAWDISIREIL